jgi:hypothetical protein
MENPMRIRTTILAAAFALLPALAIAQTATPDAGSAATNPSTASPSTGAPATAHQRHDRAARQQHRAEARQKYQQLSATDKAKFNEIRKQIRELHQQQMQLLGMKKS